MSNINTDNNIEKKKISHDFIEKVKKYLIIDDQLSELKNKTKTLNTDKNVLEESILEYLTDMGETVIDTNDGKLKKSKGARANSKSQKVQVHTPTMKQSKTQKCK